MDPLDAVEISFKPLKNKSVTQSVVLGVIGVVD